VIAAAVLATKPSPIGVENCWSVWLSSDRRGRKERRELRQHGEEAQWRRGALAHGGAELA